MENVEENKDALDELFVAEEKTVSHETLRDLLINYLQFSPDGGIFFLPDFENLTSEQKILLYLIAKKILKLKLGRDELTSPKEVQDATGLPRGTVNPTMVFLANKRLVQNIKGKYFVPNYAISRIKNILEIGEGRHD